MGAGKDSFPGAPTHKVPRAGEYEGKHSPASAEIRQGQLEIEAPWQADLVALIEEGTAGGMFRPGPPGDRAVQIRALLDGFAVPLAIGLPGARREEALAQTASGTAALLGRR